MVVDCSIIVTVQPTAKLGTEEQKSEELLFPERHKITLPLNGLNMLFSTCETAFNHSTQVATDRYDLLAKTLCNTDGSPKNHALNILFFSNFFLDFDGFSHVSALEQNFNPNALDSKRKEKRGRVHL